MKKKCNLCSGENVAELLDFGLQPIVHHYLTQQNSEQKNYPFAMCYCKECGLVQITEPISPEILYENYITLSAWKSQPHISRILDLLKKFPQISTTSKVLEVGSNDGIFLKALREIGYTKMLGIEPAHDARESALKENIDTMGIFFNSQTADKIVEEKGKFDFFISRQNLEHIQDLKDYGEGIQKVLNPGSLVLIEVPNFDMNLNGPDYAFWEEHMNYFTRESLTHYLGTLGVQVLHFEVVLFSGEALLIFGEYLGPGKVATATTYAKDLVSRIEKFKNNWSKYKIDIQTKLEFFKKKNKKIALYGAGARATNFINFCEIGPLLDCIVDDQLEKQNKYLPGSRLPILPSSALNSREVGLCLLAVNAENETKVINKHSAFIERGGKFTSVFVPSSRLFDAW